MCRLLFKRSLQNVWKESRFISVFEIWLELLCTDHESILQAHSDAIQSTETNILLILDAHIARVRAIENAFYTL